MSQNRKEQCIFKSFNLKQGQGDQLRNFTEAVSSVHIPSHSSTVSSTIHSLPRQTTASAVLVVVNRLAYSTLMLKTIALMGRILQSSLYPLSLVLIPINNQQPINSQEENSLMEFSSLNIALWFVRKWLMQTVTFLL